MEELRQIDSKDILGPVYDAMPGGAPPPDVRDDYLESYAGDRFVGVDPLSSAPIRPSCPSWPRNCPASTRPPRSCADETIHLCRWPTRVLARHIAQQQDGPSSSWALSRGRKCRTYTGTCSSAGSGPGTGSALTSR